MVVCPTAHRDYQIGTFSLGVYNENSGSFDVEILLAPEEYPLVPPPNRISCDDVPEEEIISAKAGSDQDVFCLQDTETFERDYSDVEPGFEFQFVLPIPAGFFLIFRFFSFFYFYFFFFQMKEINIFYQGARMFQSLSLLL